MNFEKVLLIIQREYLTRILKKSFFVMTIIGPALFGALMIVPIWISSLDTGDTQLIEVVDENADLGIDLPESEKLNFVYLHLNIEAAKKLFLQNNHEGLLYLPKLNLDDPKGIVFYSKSNLSLELKQTLEVTLSSEIEKLRLIKAAVDPEIIEKIHTGIDIQTVNMSDTGEKQNNTTASTIAGLFGAILIYFFIFLYGTQVMRGVIEEKTNRIIEVIITSLKPFELMMGKIIGIAGVALTQFLLWTILTFAISTVISSRFRVDRFSDANFEKTIQTINMEKMDQAMEMNKIVSAFQSLNIPYLMAVFVFFFIFGYLLYSALFAAIGSLVDNETDSQQFMFPVTIPLMLAFVFAQTIIRQPDSPLAFWLSIIPFTSPIIMMVRLPFGVPLYELIVSMVLLVIFFLLFTGLAARIYRVGILMYGKKPTYREIARWLFYR